MVCSATCVLIKKLRVALAILYIWSLRHLRIRLLQNAVAKNPSSCNEAANILRLISTTFRAIILLCPMDVRRCSERYAWQRQQGNQVFSLISFVVFQPKERTGWTPCTSCASSCAQSTRKKTCASKALYRTFSASWAPRWALHLRFSSILCNISFFISK